MKGFVFQPAFVLKYDKIIPTISITADVIRKMLATFHFSILLNDFPSLIKPIEKSISVKSKAASIITTMARLYSANNRLLATLNICIIVNNQAL